MPDPHHEGEPEIFPPAGQLGQADQPLPDRVQHPPRRPVRGDRRQRAGGAPASGRRQVLLRPGPQENPGIPRREARQRGLSQQAGQPDGAGAAPRQTGRRNRPPPRAPTPAQAERGAYLAKADLVTDMVGEFPELQGIMGRYYAAHDGEPEAVARAIEQHYWPRFAGDALPQDNIGCGGRPGGQARYPGGHLRHRPGADRRQGPLRPAPPRAGRAAHADRSAAAAGPGVLAATWPRRNSRPK